MFLSEPISFWSSATIALLACWSRVGDAMILLSFRSLSRVALSCWRFLSTVSRALVLAEAVYYIPVLASGIIDCPMGGEG